MNKATPLYSRPLLAAAYFLFFIVIGIIAVPYWFATRQEERDLSLVATARHEAQWVMPPYKDNFHRDYYWVLTGSEDYRLEMKGAHEAVVWLGEPDSGSYLRVNMRQIGDGAWSVLNAQMFIDPKIMVQNQQAIRSGELHKPQFSMDQ